MTRASKPSYFIFAMLLLLLVGCPASDINPPPNEPPDATIEYFRSKDGRTSIAKGESVTLEWRALNTTTCLIQFTLNEGGSGDPQPVPCEGEQPYTPDKTANYRFSALKKDGRSYETKDLKITIIGPDTTPPQVTSTSPEEGASGVSLNLTAISISFSEAMSKSITQAAFSTSPAIDCAFTWTTDADVLECDPEGALSSDTPYTISLSTGATDEAGNAITNPFSFTFTTGPDIDVEPPELEASSPNNGATDISVDTNIELEFSEPMKKSETETAFKTSPFVSCDFFWNSDATKLTCNPNTNLLPDTTYGITLATSATDLAGNALASVFSSSFTTTSAEPPPCTVSIPDDGLEAAIRDALAKPSGDLTCDNLLSLTELVANSRGIQNLDGLEKATNLTELTLKTNQIMSLESLRGLTKLTYLDLGENQITSLEPLRNLTNLSSLFAFRNDIVNITSLKNLTKLTLLTLFSNDIVDLEPLSGLTELMSLGLGGNDISNVQPLAGLTKLTKLSLDTNELTNITPLESLKNLEELNLFRNDISNIVALAGLTKLTKLTLGNNKLKNITSLENLINLNTLGLAENEIDDITSLVDNLGLGNGDDILLEMNCLNIESGSDDRSNINVLLSRGAKVTFIEQKSCST